MKKEKGKRAVVMDINLSLSYCKKYSGRELSLRESRSVLGVGIEVREAEVGSGTPGGGDAGGFIAWGCDFNMVGAMKLVIGHDFDAGADGGRVEVGAKG